MVEKERACFVLTSRKQLASLPPKNRQSGRRDIKMVLVVLQVCLRSVGRDKLRGFTSILPVTYAYRKLRRFPLHLIFKLNYMSSLTDVEILLATTNLDRRLGFELGHVLESNDACL